MKKTIGLDIGGTKITGVVWDGKSIVKELTIVTPKTLFEFRHNLGKLVNFLRGRDRIDQIGIGMAGFVDKKNKLVLASPNIRYIKNFSLQKQFKELGFKKIAADNDAGCFLRAEVLAGEAKPFKHAVGLIFGTGVGGAFFFDGRPYRGADNLGGEVGRLFVGGSPSWETEYQKSRDQRDFKRLAQLTANGLFMLVQILNPEVFVLGGGVAVKEGGKFLPAVKKDLKRRLLDRQRVPEILISKLNNAGAVGAALLLK
ncbi:MAG: ROK family protein [Patescibacteria group bacterium]|nr:ROK family protein [Patescibacteria group bacterium]